MIEFRAECGHTVRARDEDAGGVVRCSYCGRDADVPDTGSPDLDVLLSEIDRGGQSAEAVSLPRRGRRRRSGDPGDVFAIALKLCYATLLLIIIILVWHYGIKDQFFGQPSTPPAASSRPAASSGGSQLSSQGGSSAPMGGPSAGRARYGLVSAAGRTGMYVSTVPSGGTVYCVEQGRAPAHGRIHRVQGCRVLGVAGRSYPVPDGTYVVEVAFAWSNAALKPLAGYRDFRLAIRHAGARARVETAQDYFVPDGADVVFVDEDSDGQIYLIRQYRNVEVRAGRSQGVRSLFLPRMPADDGETFSVDALLVGHDHRQNAYSFRSEENVRDELEFYGVASDDISSVIRVLHRLGVAPYDIVEGDQILTMLFGIGIHDGAFTAKTIRTTLRS